VLGIVNMLIVCNICVDWYK